MTNKTYTISCKKSGPTPSNPCFINFGKKRKSDHRHKNIVGQIVKRTENNTLGNPEEKVLIVFTANSSLSQNDIIRELKKGEVRRPFK